jgi:hypothetical protein
VLHTGALHAGEDRSCLRSAEKKEASEAAEAASSGVSPERLGGADARVGSRVAASLPRRKDAKSPWQAATTATEAGVAKCRKDTRKCRDAAERGVLPPPPPKAEAKAKSSHPCANKSPEKQARREAAAAAPEKCSIKAARREAPMAAETAFSPTSLAISLAWRR